MAAFSWFIQHHTVKVLDLIENIHFLAYVKYQLKSRFLLNVADRMR